MPNACISATPCFARSPALRRQPGSPRYSLLRDRRFPCCTAMPSCSTGVQDAGNVGTILRSAAAAGVVDVLLGPGCAGAWTMKVLRAAQGAHFSLQIREQADLLAAVRASAVMSVATVACEGQDLYQLDLSGPVLWLLGSEGAGLSPSLRAAAGAAITIPIAAATESLNVAATAAVCLFEARRQRRQTKRPAPGGPSR
jgi:TrmH family RNA methyltransferase